MGIEAHYIRLCVRMAEAISEQALVQFTSLRPYYSTPKKLNCDTQGNWFECIIVKASFSLLLNVVHDTVSE